MGREMMLMDGKLQIRFSQTPANVAAVQAKTSHARPPIDVMNMNKTSATLLSPYPPLELTLRLRGILQMLHQS